MKILHTSDLHIGKKIANTRDRYDDYREVFRGLCEICREEKVELVLIAGDVFDTYTPSAESEKIFYRGVKDLAGYSSVLIISGNHDDYVRLTAASALAEELGIYIVGNNLDPLPVKKHAGAYPIASDSGYAIFANDRGEKVYINTLPYPNEARFKEGKSDETFAEKMKRWIDYGRRGNTENLPSIFLSHIFVVGGKVSESEREIDLGGARAVPTELLPDCAYCALGHLHKRQKIGDKVYYCGAPMQFAFDEAGAEKSVNVFDIDKDGVHNFRQIELACTRKLAKVQANTVEEGLKLLSKYSDFYVELTLNLSAPMSSAESAAVNLCENLVSLKVELPGVAINSRKISNKNKSSSELFTDFYKSKYDDNPPQELLSLFLSLTEEE